MILVSVTNIEILYFLGRDLNFACICVTLKPGTLEPQNITEIYAGDGLWCCTTSTEECKFDIPYDPELSVCIMELASIFIVISQT